MLRKIVSYSAAALRLTAGLTAGLTAVLAMMTATPAHAQADADNYPAKPVRVIIPFAAGGSTDILGRLVSELLNKELGQPFLVVNVTGAGGTIGAIQVAKAAPDGHTLMIGTPGTIINNPNINKDIGYDPIKDYQGVTSVWSQPAVVIVRKGGRYSTLKEFIADARKRPGALNYGSSGVGAFNHLSAELFSMLAGVNLTHVPYKGVAPAVTDLMAGNVDVVFSGISSLLSASERLAGLAIAAPTRSAYSSTLPTSAEAGLPDYHYSSWGGLFTTAGTPPRVTEKLRVAIVKSVGQDMVKKRFEDQAVDLMISESVADFQRYVVAEYKKGTQLIARAKLKNDN